MDTPKDFAANTVYFQKTYPDVYQDFFSRCTIVCSVSRAHAITGDHTVPNGGIMMVQRVRWRNYVGLEPVDDERIRLARPRLHLPETSFVDHDFTRIFEERVAPLIRTFLDAHGHQKIRGLGIHVLTEGPPPRITGAYGAVSAALSASLHVLVGALTPDTVRRWAQTPTRDLLRDPTSGFDPVFRFALQVKSAFDLSAEGGGIVFAALLSSVAPTLFYWQKTAKELPHLFPTSFRMLTFDQAKAAVRGIPYWGVHVDELLAAKTPIPFTWPIDLMTVNIGKVVSAGNAHRTLSDLEQRFRHFSDALDSTFAPLITRGDPLPPLYHRAKEEQGSRLWEVVPLLSMKVSATVIARFLDVFGRGISEDALRSFLCAADAYRHWIHVNDIDLPVQDELAARLHTRAHAMKIPIAVKPYPYGGEVLIMTPLNTFRDAFQEEVEQFRKDACPALAVDWLSWRDGHERRGLRVEQDLRVPIAAKFLGRRVCTVRAWDVAGVKEERHMSTEQCATLLPTFDLFLDGEGQAIFIRGKKLTSREVHSVRKTLEILHVLLERPGEWVSAKEFPASSYNDRNEMQSKIVSPLRAIVKKRLKKELPLQLRGSVGSRFAMRFSPTGLRIGTTCSSVHGTHAQERS